MIFEFVKNLWDTIWDSKISKIITFLFIVSVLLTVSLFLSDNHLEETPIDCDIPKKVLFIEVNDSLRAYETIYKAECVQEPNQKSQKTEKIDTVYKIFLHFKDEIVRILHFSALSLFFGLTFYAVKKRSIVYHLRKRESAITWSQIFLLVSFGIWLIGTILVFNISNNDKMSLPIAVIGAVMAWTFQDIIKSVAAFLYLRLNDKIHIDDWIEIKSIGIDGIVKGITLSSVIIENWDTTTSICPTYMLLSGHFQNNQRMMKGYTEGRRMLQIFTFDTGWMRKLTDKDIINMRKELNIHENHPLFDKITESMFNFEAYRLYIFYYLHTHAKVSIEPRLFVRWAKHTSEGMQLELYAFITETNLASFEWEQSQIMEHIIKSLHCFGMRLFQTPSAYDASNSNVFLTDKEATYGVDE